MKILTIIPVIAAFLGLTACHTTSGLGQDVEDVGEEMQEASEEIH